MFKNVFVLLFTRTPFFLVVHTEFQFVQSNVAAGIQTLREKLQLPGKLHDICTRFFTSGLQLEMKPKNEC